MTLGNHNSPFTLMVYDGNKYRACYTPPHATADIKDSAGKVTIKGIYGDVKMTDSIVTPPEEGKAGDGTTGAMSIAPSPSAVSNAIATALKNELLPAARAKHLTTGKTIKLSYPGSTFAATVSNALSADETNISFSGILPLEAIPKSAQERLVICSSKDAALTQAKNGEIQQGDVVQIPEGSNDGHNIMYYMYNVYSANATFDSLFKIFTAGHATDADKLNTNAGSSTKPIYFSNGVPVACSATVGGTAKPAYMNGGTITACSADVGGTAKPAYMNGGTITACSADVGNSTKPVYMSGGTITACTSYSEASVKYATSAGTASQLSSSAGSSTQPIYFSNGKPVNCSYTIKSSVPENAKFTDTTYTALKNPYALSFSGGSDVSYDGSSKQTVTIPIKVTD